MMKKMVMGFLVIALSLLAGIAFVPGSFAGEGTASGRDVSAWQLDVTANLKLTGTEPVETFTGKVVKVEKMPGVSDGVQLRIVTDEKAKLVVLLGPGWFIKNQKIKFMAKDEIEVRGLKKGNIIIASEASKGDWTMKLRNEEDGLPVWQCCFPRNK